MGCIWMTNARKKASLGVLQMHVDEATCPVSAILALKSLPLAVGYISCEGALGVQIQFVVLTLSMDVVQMMGCILMTSVWRKAGLDVLQPKSRAMTQQGCSLQSGNASACRLGDVSSVGNSRAEVVASCTCATYPREGAIAFSVQSDKSLTECGLRFGSPSW